jgi:hypothetical protein
MIKHIIIFTITFNSILIIAILNFELIRKPNISVLPLQKNTRKKVKGPGQIKYEAILNSPFMPLFSLTSPPWIDISKKSYNL